MKTWMRRSLIGGALLSVLALVGGLAACSHRPHGPGFALSDAEAQQWRERMVERIGQRMDLDAAQKARLATLGEALDGQRKALMPRAADGQPARWINLEYLSAESYVERSHGLPSPVMQGPGRGLSKRFFYPGFTPATGGLLREPDLLQRQARFDRRAWLAAQGIALRPGVPRVSLFCYEPPALPDLLSLLARQGAQLLVTAGRATAAVQTCGAPAGLEVHYLPHLTQDEYDHLLWSCDLNFVRGEDSLVRALWAGRPFVWQIYPQHDDAHHGKLEAFLRQIQAPASLRAWHRTWNGLDTAPVLWPDLSGWHAAVQQARESLLAQPDIDGALVGGASLDPRGFAEIVKLSAAR